MTYFEAVDGTTYPTSEIASISKAHEVTFSSGRKGKTRTVRLRSGDEVEATEVRVREILRAPAQAFAAIPGTYVITYDDEGVIKWPVIGWAITLEGDV